MESSQIVAKYFTEFQVFIKEARERRKREENTPSQLIALEQGYRLKLIKENGTCRKCPRVESLTLDHIIPKDFLKQLGIDVTREFYPENLMLLCKPCNMFKTNRLDFALPETKPLLLKFLERI